MTLYPGHVSPELLEEGDTAYIVPWGIYEVQGKFYIPKIFNLAPEVQGTCTVPVTRQNGVLVIGAGHDKPNHVNFDWPQLQECIEVTLHDV